MVQHYGRKLGRTSSSKKSSKSSKSSSESSSESKGGDIPDIPVCPNVDMDLSTAISADTSGDSTIIYEGAGKNFGSDVLLEVSPSQCGDMHTMINFDVRSLLTGQSNLEAAPLPILVERASILINAIEGADMSGAIFLQTPHSDWSEDTITWRNAPEYEHVIGSLNTVENGMVSLICE
jgi:hypothetical protein